MSTKAKEKNMDRQFGEALFSDSERFEMFIAAHWKTCAICAIAIAVGVAVVYGVSSNYASRNQKAAYALVDAKNEDLAEALKKYPNAPGAVMARWRLAQFLNEKKEYAAAQKQYQLIADDDSTVPMLRNQASIAIAKIYITAGKTADAIAAYKKLSADTSRPIEFRAETGLSAARLLTKNGKLDEAVELLQRVESFRNEPQASMYAEMAKMQLIAIENQEYGTYKVAPKAKAK